MNPALPSWHHVPDPEARHWQDGRTYVYGSYDLGGDTAYCSFEYRVFSSPDLVEWTDHGVSFRTSEPSAVPWGRDLILCAPDCVYKDGLYHLFFCTEGDGEGVATSASPTGPFEQATPVEGAHGDAIDPAVLVDDDGEVYLYWGQFHCRAARLRPGLRAIDPATLETHLLTEEEHGFHEGASIRKRDGVYYLLYTDISRGKATCISYATSASPLGPFTKGGVVIDNAGCDPRVWNNHGSIAEHGGRWYVFYHRSSRGSRYSRRMCIEEIAFAPDGSIPEVEMTTQGVSPPLPASEEIDAWRACLLSGSVRAESSGHRRDGAPPSEHLTLIEDGDWAAYKYVDFGSGAAGFEATVASGSYGGRIEVRLDAPAGPLVATCPVPATGGWDEWRQVRCRVAHVDGIHGLFLVFRGRRSGRLFDLLRVRFQAFPGAGEPGRL